MKKCVLFLLECFSLQDQVASYRASYCSLNKFVHVLSNADLASCDQKFLRTLPKFVIHLPLLAKNASTNGQDGDLTLENYSMVFNICPREEIAV